eukprot:scaffold117857_cov33-Tisochrysis_lutea.AAC.3
MSSPGERSARLDWFLPPPPPSAPTAEVGVHTGPAMRPQSPAGRRYLTDTRIPTGRPSLCHAPPHHNSTTHTKLPRPARAAAGRGEGGGRISPGVAPSAAAAAPAPARCAPRAPAAPSPAAHSAPRGRRRAGLRAALALAQPRSRRRHGMRRVASSPTAPPRARPPRAARAAPWAARPSHARPPVFSAWAAGRGLLPVPRRYRCAHLPFPHTHRRYRGEEKSCSVERE